MRLSRKQQLITKHEHGMDCADYGEAMRLGAQAGDAEAAGELAPINGKVRASRIRN